MVNTQLVEVLAEFNLVFPINLGVALYDKRMLRGQATLTAVRHAFFYTGYLAFVYKFYVVFAVMTTCLALSMAITLLQEPIPLKRRATTLYFIACAIMPLNYVLNILATRRTPFALYFAIAQSIIRAAFIVIIIVLLLIYPDYANAWSCYQDKPITEYTNGLCPLYDNNWQSWACTDNQVNNNPCLGIQDPSFDSHVLMHVSLVISSILYGQHFVTVLVQTQAHRTLFQKPH